MNIKTKLILTLFIASLGALAALSGIAVNRMHLLSDIFNSFVQENSTDTRRYGDAGLGLTLSKRLVELMGGSIYVESSVGHGSLFRLVIPFTVFD